MIIRANELNKYMELHGVDKVAVEVVNTEVPALKAVRQGIRTLAKRLVITGVDTNGWGNVADRTRINYAMYNSFKKSKCYLPDDFELDVLTGADGERVLTEYTEHAGGLEKKFRETFAQVNPEIQAKLKAASDLIGEAEALAEQHGLPFRPDVDLAGHSMSYIPKSLDAIFGDLNDESTDLIADLTGAYGNEYDGWQSSQVC